MFPLPTTSLYSENYLFGTRHKFYHDVEQWFQLHYILAERKASHLTSQRSRKNYKMGDRYEKMHLIQEVSEVSARRGVHRASTGRQTPCTLEPLTLKGWLPGLTARN